MNQEAKLDLILDAIDEVYEASPRIRGNRCLTTSVLANYLLNKVGISCELWHGSARWFSIEFVKRSNKFGDKFPKKMAKNGDAWRGEGVMYVDCRANEYLNSNSLGGHMALILNVDGDDAFIDPTCFQFQRNLKDNNAEIFCPRIFAYKDKVENLKKEIFVSNEKFGACIYNFETIDEFTKMQSYTGSARYNSDINPRRYTAEFNEIIKKLKAVGITIN